MASVLWMTSSLWNSHLNEDIRLDEEILPQSLPASYFTQYIVSLSGLWVHMGWRKETQPVISATHPMLQTFGKEMWSAISLSHALQIMASFLHNVKLYPQKSLGVPSCAFIHSYLESWPFSMHPPQCPWKMHRWTLFYAKAHVRREDTYCNFSLHFR